MSRFVTLLLRAALLWLVWWSLTDGDPAGLMFGAVVSLLVAWLSIPLFAPSPYRIHLRAVPAFALFFLSRSLLAALDVARRLLTPSLPITPGYLCVSLSLPGGLPRWLLANTLSLLPGTLSVSLNENSLELHCLDLTEPVKQEVEYTEGLIAALFGLPLRSEKVSG